MNPLIEPRELAEIVDSAEATSAIANAAPLLLDVRWVLGGPDGRTEFENGHIPEAVYVDLESELAADAEAGEGRHPLPSIDVLRAAAARWGIHAGRTVVVYDDNGGMSAARAWWLLRHAGHAEVRVLNGGLAAWTRAGGLVQSGAAIVSPAPGATDYLEYGSLSEIDADGAAELAANGLLLDARAGERYRGEVEPIDPVAGHIPGAISAPTTLNLDHEGRMLSAVALRERFAALGVDGSIPVGVYCGSGVTAAHEALALAVAGVDAALYPGSWSQWSNLPGRPVATGA